MYNIAFCSEKSCLVWIRREICDTDQTLFKWKKSKTVLNKYMGGFWCERTTEDGLFTEGSIHLDYSFFLAKSNGLKLKHFSLLLKRFSLHKILIDGLEWCGLLWCFYQLYMDSHSDGTHSLQRIHWWANDVMLHSPNLLRWRNKLIYMGDLNESKFSANFHFWVNYSF